MTAQQGKKHEKVEKRVALPEFPIELASARLEQRDILGEIEIVDPKVASLD